VLVYFQLRPHKENPALGGVSKGSRTKFSRRFFFAALGLPGVAAAPRLRVFG
jgi:hypothetical protein